MSYFVFICLLYAYMCAYIWVGNLIDQSKLCDVLNEAENWLWDNSNSSAVDIEAKVTL